MKPVDMGMKEAIMVRGQSENLSRGLTSTLFERHAGIFNDHRESGPWFNVLSEGRAFYSIVSPSLYWGVRTHTDHRVSTPCWSH